MRPRPSEPKTAVFLAAASSAMMLIVGCSPADLATEEAVSGPGTTQGPETTSIGPTGTTSTTDPGTSSTSTPDNTMTTTDEGVTTTADVGSTTSNSPPPGQFSSWVGGGDPGPCDELAGVSPPYFGLGYGSTSAALGSVVRMCFLGFAIKSPIEVLVEQPDGGATSFEVWLGTNTDSDPLTDPLTGSTMDSAGDLVSWVLRSHYPAGTYSFSATQGDVVLDAQIDFVVGDTPFVEAVDGSVPIGTTAWFTISGGPPGEAVPLYVYRDTGILDTNHPEGCDLCSIFELVTGVDSVAADDNGGALFGLSIDEAYRASAETTNPHSENAYCLVTTLSPPSCDLFTGGGWFEVED